MARVWGNVFPGILIRCPKIKRQDQIGESDRKIRRTASQTYYEQANCQSRKAKPTIVSQDSHSLKMIKALKDRNGGIAKSCYVMVINRPYPLSMGKQKRNGVANTNLGFKHTSKSRWTARTRDRNRFTNPCVWP